MHPGWKQIISNSVYLCALTFKLISFYYVQGRNVLYANKYERIWELGDFFKKIFCYK